MAIYLIRHTTPDIEKGICYGQTDLELASTYQEEFKAVLKQLPKQIDRVYTSPLKRCLQLAEAILANPIQDNRLKEIDFGDWEMQKWEDIPNKDIQPWYDDYVNVPSKNGESLAILSERVLDFYRTLNHHPDETICIVAHSGVIRVILAHLDSIALKDCFQVIGSIGYGTVVSASLNHR